MSGFVSGIIKDRSAKVFRASKAEPSSTERETPRIRSDWGGECNHKFFNLIRSNKLKPRKMVKGKDTLPPTNV